MLRIGIDIGGTFTDFVIFTPGSNQVQTLKLLSTPHEPAQAVLQGLEKLGFMAGEQTGPIQIIHGSTVATNALLERKGARTALVTTQGFGDVIQIGRQNRPALYDLFADPPQPLVPAALRLEVAERVSSTGEVLTPLNLDDIKALLPKLGAGQVESVAVCLLFSFLHPEHESMLASHLRAAGYTVSVSSEIIPEYREYERMSTTVINAYVSPVLDRYLSSLEETLHNSPGSPSLSIMQSNGGVIQVGEARRFGVRCVLSGPAGGVVGCQFIGAAAQTADHRLRLITFDMGGTSTDVSLIDGSPIVTTEAMLDGLPIRIPMLDIHTIGAGGGSIIRVDPGGALRVGPESAGANPGPACYGRWDPAVYPDRVYPTVTDANLVLGRLAPEFFLGGAMPLQPEHATWVLNRLSREAGLTPVETALGAVAVANAHMERALRVISVERGHDPRDFTLLSFGGAGGLHAVDLARCLGIPRVLVPPYASTLSALGMLASDVVKDYSLTVMLPGDTSTLILDKVFASLLAQGRAELLAENIDPKDMHLEQALDMRYQGQSYELWVPYLSRAGFLDAFHAAHKNAYGYCCPEVDGSQVEIVNVRLKATGRVPRPALPQHLPAGVDPARALMGLRTVYFKPTSPENIPFYRGEDLEPGNLLSGPAIILRSDTTILLGHGDQAEVDAHLNLIIQVAPES